MINRDYWNKRHMNDVAIPAHFSSEHVNNMEMAADTTNAFTLWITNVRLEFSFCRFK